MHASFLPTVHIHVLYKQPNYSKLTYTDYDENRISENTVLSLHIYIHLISVCAFVIFFVGQANIKNIAKIKVLFT